MNDHDEDHDLGQMPAPTTEEPQLVPGGVDALPEDPADTGLARDLGPEDNPAVPGMPGEIAESDDKSQAPDGEAEDHESGTQSASPAGQVAEDGSVEPPA